MINLLQIEFQKLKPYRAMWIILAAYALIIFGVFHFLGKQAATINEVGVGINIFQYPDIWHKITYVSGFFNLLLALILIMYSCNEFVFRTYRQNIIDGLSHADLVLSKSWVIFFLAVLSCLFLFIVGAIKGYYPDGLEGMNFFSKKLYFLGYHFVKTIAYLSIAYLFSVIFQRTTLSIILFIAFMIFESFIASYLDINVLQFLPFGAMGQIINQPFLPEFIQRGEAVEEVSKNLLLIVTMGYAILAQLAAWIILKRKNL